MVKLDVSTIHSHTEKNLQLSELRYRRLFETAQDGILILNATSGKITDANPFLKRILGYSQVELLGKELWQIGVFKDIVGSKTAFKELQNIGYIRYKDLPLQRKDGHKVDVEFISNVYMVGKEKVIQCNIRNISDRKKAENIVKSRTQDLEKLSKAQEKTKRAMLNVMEDLEGAKAVIEREKAKDEAMLASIGDGLIAVDNHKKIIVINNVATELLGWKMKELVGKVITDLPLENENGDPLPLSKRPTTIALATGEITKVTSFFVRKDKTRFPIAITATPIKLSGKTIGLIELIRDVTHEKEVDKAKSEFVSLASHQLRTPLGIMKWYLEALGNEEYVKKSPIKIKKYVEEIYNNNERVLSLVRDLLSVSRIEQGQVHNNPTRTDLLEIITRVVEQMQLVVHKKKIVLKIVPLSRKIPLVSIDVFRFHEAIENLIGNAVEYSVPPSTVEVAVEEKNKTIFISIKDKGIGISTVDQEKIFTKFFRSEKAIRHNPEGSGLGLYVVKSYVESWGGKITVQSAEGKGSTFTISLPFSPEEHRPKKRKK
jgi:PAS domain S-box-containing protein